MLSSALALSIVLSSLAQALPIVPPSAVAYGPSSVQNINIFEHDNRKEIKKHTDINRGVGLLYSGLGDGTFIPCTATLVGRDLILTTAQCVTRDKKVLKEFLFYPHYNTRNKKNPMPYQAKGKKVWVGALDFPDATSYHKNWAFIRLDQKLGDKIGWMGIANFGPVSMAKLHTTYQISMSGYSTDIGQGTVPLTQAGCEMKGFDVNPVYYHDCSALDYAQGSPLVIMFQDEKFTGGKIDATIVALHSGDIRDSSVKIGSKIPYDLDVTSLAIGTSEIINAHKEIENGSN